MPDDREAVIERALWRCIGDDDIHPSSMNARTIKRACERLYDAGMLTAPVPLADEDFPSIVLQPGQRFTFDYGSGGIVFTEPGVYSIHRAPPKGDGNG